MELIVQPEGGFAIYEEEAAGFTYMNLTERGTLSALVSKFGMEPKAAAALLEKPGDMQKKIDRIKEIFTPAKNTHPCVARVLAKALEQRMLGVKRAAGAKKAKGEQ